MSPSSSFDIALLGFESPIQKLFWCNFPKVLPNLSIGKRSFERSSRKSDSIWERSFPGMNSETSILCDKKTERTFGVLIPIFLKSRYARYSLVILSKGEYAKLVFLRDHIERSPHFIALMSWYFFTAKLYDAFFDSILKIRVEA